MSNALQSVQDSFAAQRARDLAAMERSNKLILMVVSTFAALGFLTLLMMSYLQWRMSKGLVEITAAVPAALGLAAGSTVGALGPAGQSNLPLRGVMPHHESRVPQPLQSASPSPKPLEAPNRAPELKLIHDPVTSLRRGRTRPLRTAVVSGLCGGAGVFVLSGDLQETGIRLPP